MILATRFGPAWATINESGALEAFGFGDSQWRARGDSPVLATQLREYCEGARTAFQLELNLCGTEFQVRVWQELCRISFGSAITYAELARRVERPGAARRRRQGQCHQPHLADCPLPSGTRFRRKSDRLRLWPPNQRMPARMGGS